MWLPPSSPMTRTIIWALLIIWLWTINELPMKVRKNGKNDLNLFIQRPNFRWRNSIICNRPAVSTILTNSNDIRNESVAQPKLHQLWAIWEVLRMRAVVIWPLNNLRPQPCQNHHMSRGQNGIWASVPRVDQVCDCDWINFGNKLKFW